MLISHILFPSPTKICMSHVDNKDHMANFCALWKYSLHEKRYVGIRHSGYLN